MIWVCLKSLTGAAVICFTLQNVQKSLILALISKFGRAMLTLLIFDFQSNPAPLPPSWHSLKVRVQGSCVLCAHNPALFIPNQPPVSPPSLLFFFLCQSGEMHHKGHGHGFPLVWLHEKVRWGHHEMAVRPSHRPHRDRSPCITLKMAQAEPLWGRPHQNHEGPLSPHDLVWSPCGFSVPSAACRKEQRNNLRCKVCYVLCGTKLFFKALWSSTVL